VVLGSAISGAGATRTTLLTDLAVIAAVQLPVSLWAVLAPGASLPRLWWAVAATYWISGAVYVGVYQLAPWARAAFAGHAGSVDRVSG
jgi:Na+-driven multidrug efflux pump